MKFANSLFGRVVIALILGVGIGIVAPDFAKCLQPLGDGFVKLIQMIIDLPSLVSQKSFFAMHHKARLRGTIKGRHRYGLTLDMTAPAERRTPNAERLLPIPLDNAGFIGQVG